MINLCNKFFEVGIRKKLISSEERICYEEYGKSKANFLIGLCLGGKEFLNGRIRNTQSL